jgi:nucleotide-binding universal stress UspA family protein
MKVLLAIDDSKFSEAATQAVIQHMRPDRTDVWVLHAVEPLLLVPSEYIGEVTTLEAAQQQRLKEGKELVVRAKELLEKVGFKVQTAVEEGDPRSTILDYAAHTSVDVVVVGSHGRKGLYRFLMGSVAESVARHAVCSVWIVRIPMAR